jgi:hypothetical protein
MLVIPNGKHVPARSTLLDDPQYINNGIGAYLVSGSRSGKKKRIRFDSDLSNPSRGKHMKRRTESISERSPNPNPKETKAKNREKGEGYP